MDLTHSIQYHRLIVYGVEVSGEVGLYSTPLLVLMPSLVISTHSGDVEPIMECFNASLNSQTDLKLKMTYKSK